MEVRVSEQPLPGIGKRFDIDVGDGRRLFVIAHRDGRRVIGLTGTGDTPEALVPLDPQVSVALAAMLLGARFTVDTREETWVSSDEVVVDVVELTAGSPIVGMVQEEIGLDDPEAVMLAVMSDSTPELVEAEGHYRCQVGDRIVVAARAGRITQLAATLRGAGPAGS